MKSIDQLCINTIRFLAVDAVEKANSGHPGMPLGAAPMAYVLWDRFLKHNPHNPRWFDRDRFILSAGHGSMLLYALLHLYGYDLSLDDLKNLPFMTKHELKTGKKILMNFQIPLQSIYYLRPNEIIPHKFWKF